MSDLPRIADLGITLRRARQGDAGAAAQLYLCARRAAMPGIPPLAHADDDVRCWFRDVVIPDREVWLAESHGELIALMVLHADQLDQLYVHPEWTGRGVGSELLRRAQRERPDGLWLWTFQSNHGAQRFYERHGFVAVERGNGSGNEEQAPDIRYVWPPGGTVVTGTDPLSVR